MGFISISTVLSAGLQTATTSGRLKSTSEPLLAENAFPTSRLNCAFRVSGALRPRSLQTISSLSAMMGGTRHPTRSVENSMPCTRSSILSAHVSVSSNRFPQIQQGVVSSAYGVLSSRASAVRRDLPRSSLVSPNDCFPKNRPRQWLHIVPYARISRVSSITPMVFPSCPFR